LRDALNQLPDGILITAADGTVLAANTALTKLVPARAGEPLRDPNLLDAIAGASLSGSATVKLTGQPELLTVSVAPLQGGSALVFGR
jgi:PAS domain-containing protein